MLRVNITFDNPCDLAGLKNKEAERAFVTLAQKIVAKGAVLSFKMTGQGPPIGAKADCPEDLPILFQRLDEITRNL